MAVRSSEDAEAATERMLAVIESHNHKTMLAFLAAICGLTLTAVVLHYGFRWADNRMRFVRSGASMFIRKARRAALKPVYGLPTGGHRFVVFLYASLNLIIAFTNLEWTVTAPMHNLASRFGWMAVGNLAVLVIVALKNTPLSVLSVGSYERLNAFHMVAGYTVIFLVILHGSLFSAFFVQTEHEPAFLLRRQDIFGMTAGISFVLTGLTATFIRRWWYEAFYYLHVFFWLVAIVSLGLHQPKFEHVVIFVTMVIATAWGIDRTVRWARLFRHCLDNTATLTPLSNGGTLVTLRNAPNRSCPGKHCFLWLPCVRLLETHPFTIAATEPLEFVIKSHDGFTRDLHRYATENPGLSVKVAVDGPYGSVPSPAGFDKVVLVAGGSGASFAAGVALDMCQKSLLDASTKYSLIWTIKDACKPFEWFSKQVLSLQLDGRVSTKVYLTRPHEHVDEDKVDSAQTNDSSTLHGDVTMDQILIPGKPDTYAVVKSEIEGMKKGERVMVLACAPHGMMKQVRQAVADSMTADGPFVEFHSEQFGW